MRTIHPQPPRRRPPPLLRRRSLLILLAAVSLQLGCKAPNGDLPTLAPGRHPLAGGELHRYPVPLAAGQFLRVVVAEEGIDVRVGLSDPEGKEVVHVDGPNQPHEDEDLAAVADRTGLYHLRVSTTDGKEAKGNYRILRVERRQAGEAERARARATRLTQEAVELMMLKNGEAPLRQQIAKREAALAIWRRLGESGHTAAALYQLGTARFALEEYEPAAQDLAQAAALWREVGAKVDGADAFNQLGLVEHALDRWEEARRDYEAGLALLAGAESDPLLKVKILNNLGSVYTDLSASPMGGNPSRHLGHEALRCYRQSLALAGSKTPASVPNNMGLLYAALGDWEQALPHYRHALAIDLFKGNRPELAKTLNNLGLAQVQLLQTEKARKSYTQAIDLAQEAGDRKTQARALVNLGYLEISQHRPVKALELCRQALALPAGDAELEAAARDAMGAAYRDLGDLGAAGTELDRALRISRQRGDADREAHVFLNLGRLARARGDLKGAVALTRQAVDLVESLRIRVASPDLRASYHASVQQYYEFYIDTLMAAGREAEALSASERARARSFLDLLDSAETKLRRGISPQLLERERQASATVSLADRRRARVIADPHSSPRAVAAAFHDVNAAIEEYRQVEEDVRASNPGDASLTQPLALPEIQKLLVDGTLLLEYALGEDRSYLWAVTATDIRSYTLPQRGEIEPLARRFYDQVTLHSPDRHADAAALARADAAADEAAHQLSQKVLAPAAGLLGDRRLVVVSDGALQYVPFAALPDPTATSYLVERHEIVSLPSASVLAVLRRQCAQRPPPPRSLAVLADPVFELTDERVVAKRSLLARIVQHFRHPAPHAGEPQVASRDCSSHTFHRLRFSQVEADGIAGLMSPRENVYEALGFDASLPLVTGGRLSRYGLVHFATHGCVDDRHPELSGLVLSQIDRQGRSRDGMLQLKDIYDLNLNADLVVLSACQTALGKEIRGEGLIGLTRGFLHAGSARVLASLWKVDDRATAQLMTRFYGSLLGKEPQRAAAALRQAQLAMAKDPRWSSPYYWAAFSLQGEWR